MCIRDSTCIEAGSGSLELVPQTAHGDDEPRVRRVGLHLGAQSLDVNVQGLGVTDVVTAPHPIDQLCAGQHPAGVAQQHLEQLELLERQRYVCLLYTSDAADD